MCFIPHTKWLTLMWTSCCQVVVIFQSYWSSRDMSEWLNFCWQTVTVDTTVNCIGTDDTRILWQQYCYICYWLCKNCPYRCVIIWASDEEYHIAWNSNYKFGEFSLTSHYIVSIRRVVLWINSIIILFNAIWFWNHMNN